MKLFNDDGSFNNLLDWWKENEKQYEVLAKMTRKYLAIPVTSAPSERIWSLAKSVISSKRCRLSEDVAGAYIFIRENINIFKKYYKETMGEPLDDRKLPYGETKVDFDIGQGNH